jgi:hypothetical protein
MYHPIFLAAAPGAGVRRRRCRRRGARGEDGAAAVFGAEAARYGLTARCPRDDQAAREADSRTRIATRCRSMLPGMVEAQRLRDAALARARCRRSRKRGAGRGDHRQRPCAARSGRAGAAGQAAPGLRCCRSGRSRRGRAAPPFDLWIVTSGPAIPATPHAGFR